MAFDDILAQVLDLLKHQGRVSYRALKRRFAIDDAYLEDLKEELLFVYPVTEEDERGLVWTATVQDMPPTQAKTPSVEAPIPAAERRQLTVMFCDLVGSTQLSGQLDPEDLREVIRSYQSVCDEVIQRFEGYIAQYLGDGLLIYFGYPQAHEDDAQRAVRTGLGIIEATARINPGLSQDKGVRLAVRLGIHTGLAVVGEMGGESKHEQLALGDTPNIASRIEALATPDTVAISDATYRLVEGYFTCQALGAHRLKGVDHPMPVYRVVEASRVQNRLEVATSRGLTPLVGRTQEVGLLSERWAQVQEGRGQVVLLSGEAGIGKSRLVQVLKEQVANTSHIKLECWSSPYYRYTALYPITDLLQRTLQWQPDETPTQRLAKLEHTLSVYRLPLPETVPLLATLLSLPLPDDPYLRPQLAPQRLRQKTLETLLAILLQQAERQPVLFILEDVHWADPTTLEWLTLLLEQVPTVPLMAVLTCRPEFVSPWGLRSHLTPVVLNRLTQAQLESLISGATGGQTLPLEVVQHLVEKTDGVPLYVEEMLKAILEAGILQNTDGHYALTGPLASLAIPTTLQDALMARLDRLETAKGIAQLGAVLGRQFSYEVLQAVSQQDDESLQRELARLVEAELLYQRGRAPQATYLFKHALIQDTAYQALLKSTRQRYHQRIAQVLESQFPDLVATQPELMAHHYTAANLHAQAVPYWQRAGENAIQRSANAEAINHLTKGLELLTMHPETPARISQELPLLVALGTALVAVKGFAAPEVEQVYTRAHTLCQQHEEAPQRFEVLLGLFRLCLVRAEIPAAYGLGTQLLTLATHLHDLALLLGAHYALGATLFFQGELLPAHAHLEQGLALYDPHQHHMLAFYYSIDPGVLCSVYTAETLWLLGFPEQALQHSRQAVTLAQDLAHPFTLVYAWTFAAAIHRYRREAQGAHGWAEQSIALSREQGFSFRLAQATILQGWALIAQGQEQENIAHMQQGLAMFRETGGKLNLPSLLLSLAEAYGMVGQIVEGLTAVSQALGLAGSTGERYCEAELYRLKGELLLQKSPGNQTEAETCFHQAIIIARSQQAKSWELRAATSLARLWQGQGKRQEAYELLTPVYGWFTEGFDTADLQEAKALLHELESGW